MTINFLSRYPKFTILTLLIALVTSCATTRKPDAITLDSREPKSAEDILKASKKLEGLIASLEAQLEAKENGESGKEGSPTESKGAGTHGIGAGDETVGSEMPIELNQQVKKWIRYFTVEHRERFQRYLDRGQPFRDVVNSTLKEHDLPPELFYLGLIESGYRTHAVSHASAVGVWQFIPGTGKQYGLQVDYFVDERRDPIRSTEAASKYLRDLYNVFQSWYLAMSAYNAGEYRVLGSIIKGESRDFWKLSEQKLLPKETRNYVPKFLAATIIGRNPERFGFKIANVDDYPDIEAVEVPSPVKLVDVARVTGISYELLKQVNPQLKRGITSPSALKYEIWVPEGMATQVKGKYIQIANHRIKGLRGGSHYASRESGSKYRVRRGDNLSSIARKYGVSVSYLKRINRLRSSSLQIGQTLRTKAGSYHKANAGSYATYRVKKGDFLGNIATSHRTSVSTLKRINGLKGNKVMIGQRLRVPVSVKVSQASQRKGRVKKYKVNRGDNLYMIAKKFKVDVREIKLANQLASNQINTGQVLHIPIN